MVEVLRVEAGERLRLELLQRQRLRSRERLIDHALHPPAAVTAIVAAPRRLELRERLVRLGFGHRAVLVRVEHLEQHVGALLRLGPGLVAAAAYRRRRGDCARPGVEMNAAPSASAAEKLLHVVNLLPMSAVPAEHALRGGAVNSAFMRALQSCNTRACVGGALPQ